MKLRDMVLEDLPLFEKMAVDMYAGPACLHPFTPEHAERTLRESLSPHPLTRLLLLMADDGTPAGYANISFTWSNEFGGRVIWLDELYLLPGFRGQGFGTAFFRWVGQEYTGTAAMLRLEVNPENPDARRLYERLGFRELGYTSMIRKPSAEN